MKTTRKERELMNAYYQSFLKREPVSWFEFPEEDYEDLMIGLKYKEVLHAFDMIHDYLKVNRGGSLLSKKLWNDPYFLQLYLYSGETLNRIVQEHRKRAATPIPKEPKTVVKQQKKPKFWDELQSENIHIKIK